jgi:hypothetical protein
VALEINKPPSKYRVRFMIGHDYRTIGCIAWAFSAEDAKFQVETHYKSASAFHGVIYVGPVNPECLCLGTCFCGASAVE